MAYEEVVARRGNITEFTADPNNLNKGTERGNGLIEESLEKLGAGRSIVVDKNGVIIAGNKTTEGALAIGNEECIVIQTDGKKLIVHQRTDLDMNEEAAQRLAVMDNRSSQVSLRWDEQALLDMARAIDMSPMFTQKELDQMANKLDEEAPDPKPEMELQAGEHHDYIVLVFHERQQFATACEQLGIQLVQCSPDGGFGYRKIGLGRAIDGSKVMERLCPSPL